MLNRLWSYVRALFRRPRPAEAARPESAARRAAEAPSPVPPPEAPADSLVPPPVDAVDSPAVVTPAIPPEDVDTAASEAADAGGEDAPSADEADAGESAPGESPQIAQDVPDADELLATDDANELEAAEADADEEDEEDEWADEEVEAFDDEPDPFITGTDAAETAEVDVQALRTAARAEALSGPHRIYFSNPAGPGTLAEALNLLLEEGLVEAQFVESDDDAPHILYRPLA